MFKNLNHYSSQFLHSTCDSIGYLTDDQFAECFSQYLGLPSPSIKFFQGHYIGTEEDTNVVDEFGNQVAAQRYLSGGGHIQFHHTIQHTIHQLLRRCKLQSTKEAANIFQGIVPTPYIDRYTHHYASVTRKRYDKDDALVPDILVHDYPTTSSSQPVKDGHHLMIKAMIEVKGIRITDGNYTLRGTAVEKRAAKIPGKYTLKAHTCDQQFASETLDANGNGQGPFELALATFFGGTPIGFVVGSNSEYNKATDTFIETIAKTYANTPEGMAISPDLSSRGPRGAYKILKSQFIRLLGCTAARANADLKLRRKHYIRPTKAAAIQAARSQHRDHQHVENDMIYDSADKYTKCQYHEFYQYRNSYKDGHNPNYHPHFI